MISFDSVKLNDIYYALFNDGMTACIITNIGDDFVEYIQLHASTSRGGSIIPARVTGLSKYDEVFNYRFHKLLPKYYERVIKRIFK